MIGQLLAYRFIRQAARSFAATAASSSRSRTVDVPQKTITSPGGWCASIHTAFVVDYVYHKLSLNRLLRSKTGKSDHFCAETLPARFSAKTQRVVKVNAPIVAWRGQVVRFVELLQSVTR